MSSLPSPEALPHPAGQPEQISADVVDLQEYRQEQRPEFSITGAVIEEVQLSENPNGSAELSYLYYRDRKKIEAARSDPTTFASLLEEYSGLIRYMANGYFLNGGTADDLMQEAMFGFYKAVRDYDGEHSSFKSFAELCMRHQLITAIKTANRFKHEALNEYVSFGHMLANQNGDGEGLTLGDAQPDKGRLPEDIVVGKEIFNDLIDILSSELSYLEHSALKMHLEGESYETMAEELAEDTKTIDNALQRVKRKVLEYLEAQG
jgi:RNA polymerase sporulation-specific sigma factor